MNTFKLLYSINNLISIKIRMGLTLITQSSAWILKVHLLYSEAYMPLYMSIQWIYTKTGNGNSNWGTFHCYFVYLLLKDVLTSIISSTVNTFKLLYSINNLISIWIMMELTLITRSRQSTQTNAQGILTVSWEAIRERRIPSSVYYVCVSFAANREEHIPTCQEFV